jgi:GT2 family glycosyltransferase
VFGGAILPEWPVEPPQWILDSVPLSTVYAVTDPDWEEGPIEPTCIWGPNMCIRHAVFTDGGLRFNEAVGPSGANYIMGSETEFTKRAYEKGYRAWHTRRPVVRHMIRENQLDPEWIIGRARRAGRAYGRNARLALEAGEACDVPMLLGWPHWHVRRLLQLKAAALFFRLLGRDRDWLRNAYQASLTAGLLQEFNRKGRLA